MRIVKGARYKSNKMFDLFREENGHLFIVYYDYPLVNPLNVPILYIDPNQVSLDSLLHWITEEFFISKPIKLFLYGRFFDYEIGLIRDWASGHPNIHLTVTQQTHDKEKEVEVVGVA